MPGFYLPTDEEFDPHTDDFFLHCLAKERRYQHFDLPLSDEARGQQIDFSSEAEPHRFLPLLGYTDITRKFVRDAKGNRQEKIKERPIRFAAHGNAAYLQAYADHLGPIYEAALLEDGTSDCVLAYRRGGGTNIHHAKSFFDEISQRGNCSVFALDISGFFDCLNHDHLKHEVSRLVGADRLSGHDWTVFNNVTRYSWVESDDLDKLLGKKRKRQGRVCTPDQFKAHVRGRKAGLVRTHDLDFGIPQGTPVSGLYANIYLRTFDLEILRLVSSYGGSYRRYSDDIAIVLPQGAKQDHVVGVIEKFISDFSLALSTEKTETADYRGGVLVGNRPIQYLGFTFDGHQTLIRASSLDAYRSKMKHGIHAKLVAAKQKGVPSFEVFKRETLSRYTNKGKRRNFIQYAYKSADVLNAPEIRHQVREHIKWFNDAWDREVVKVYGGLVTNA